MDILNFKSNIAPVALHIYSVSFDNTILLKNLICGQKMYKIH